MDKWQCRIAPSLGGGFAGTPNETWGTVDYTDKDKPACFFGMYGLNDFVVFQQHKGEKAIFWAGTDILHFINGYWIDREGLIKVNPMPFAQYFKGFNNYCENQVEAANLLKFGIHANIVPSFLGDVTKFPVSFKYSERPKVYASVSGDNFEVYGWDKIEEIAECVPEVEFHLYGNKKEWKTNNPNVIVHGRVSQEQMDSEIKEMACGLRVLEHDGCSEIMVKSILWGGYPITKIR